MSAIACLCLAARTGEVSCCLARWRAYMDSRLTSASDRLCSALNLKLAPAIDDGPSFAVGGDTYRTRMQPGSRKFRTLANGVNWKEPGGWACCRRNPA